MNKIPTFADWLMEQLKARNLSQADLSRMSGLTTAGVSGLISGTRNPAPESLVAIARALKLPPEVLFRAAGLLPPEPDHSPLDDEILFLFSQLPENDQEELIGIARLKLSRRGNDQTPPRIPNNPVPTDPR